MARLSYRVPENGSREAVVKRHAKKWLVLIVKYVVGFGLLGFIIHRYWGPNERTGTPGLEQLLQRPIAFDLLATAALLVAFAAGLQIVRWYVLVRALDLPFTLRDSARLCLVGFYYNTFIPGSVGGDLVKAYFLAHAHPERKTRAVASVIADRVLGLFSLVLFVAVLGSVARGLGDERIAGNSDLQRIVKLMAAVAAGTAVGFLLIRLLPQNRVDRFSGRLKSIPKIGTGLSELWGAVWVYQRRLMAVAIAVALSAGAHFGWVFAFHAASRVFPPADPGADLASVSEHLVIAPIGFIAQAIPITPGGVGVGEGVFAWLYKLSGHPETRGVLSLLSMRIAVWLIAFIGYVVYLRMRAEVREIQHEVEADEDKGARRRESGGGR